MSTDPKFPQHPGVRDIDEVKIVSRRTFEAEHAAPSKHSPSAKQAAHNAQSAGVFVPAHMLTPGATVEDAAAVARSLGVTTHAHPPAHAAAEPSGPTGPQELDHEYDGIKEYDNPTPGWWYMVWFGSMVFSVLYVVIYHSMVPTQHERLAAREAKALDVRFSELRKLPEGQDKLLAIMAEKPWLDQGASIFKSSCTLCHGQQAEGLVGPNLTDDYYKNLTTITGIYDVVLHGAANGAMPPKGGAPLKDEEVALVAAYVASLRGTNVPGPRGPEGVEIPPFPKPTPAQDDEPAGG